MSDTQATIPTAKRPLPLGPFGMLWRRRDLLWRTSWTELQARYAGSTLGMVWAAIFPILFLTVYSAVALKIYRLNYEGLSAAESIILIFCGLIPFLTVAEALGAGTGSVVSNSGLVKNTLFPIELVPVRIVLVAQTTQIVGIAILLVALAVIGRLSWTALLIPVIWIFQIMMTTGVVWILSAINVFARDLQYTVAILTLVLMMISPIAWTESMVPESIRGFIAINPLYHIIIAYQSVMLEGRIPSSGVITGLLVTGPGLFLLGWWFFSRLKKIFADHV